MGVGWEDDKRAVTYGLEPFEFDPGPQPSQEELTRDAEIRVRSDKRFREALSKEKATITAILQTCLEKVNGQLERGEEICQKAHFPLLNPRDFDDLESFARHDHFVVDLRVDKVDEALQKLVSSLFGIVWTNVHIENESKAKSLDRFCQALQERMETLEYHLQDRSKQLSNCRYAYFLEITHLRNQLYIKNQSDDENFEPVEAYFFDPTEYLEEELRQQLNDKISLSVKVYRERLNATCRELADVQLQLETLQALNAARNADDSLESYLQIACNKHGAKNVVHTLAKVAEKEMKEWAQVARGGRTPQDSAFEASGEASPGRLEQMRQAMMQAAQEAEREQHARLEAEKALQEALKENQLLKNEIDRLKGIIDTGLPPGRADALAPVQAASMIDPKEMDALRKELARMKLQLDKERSRNAELERVQAEASEMKTKLDACEEAQAALKESLQAQEVRKAADHAGHLSAREKASASPEGSGKPLSSAKEVRSRETQTENPPEETPDRMDVEALVLQRLQEERERQRQDALRVPVDAAGTGLAAARARQADMARSHSHGTLQGAPVALLSVYGLKKSTWLPPRMTFSTSPGLARRPKSSPGFRLR